MNKTTPRPSPTMADGSGSAQILDILASRPMHWRQLAIIAVCVTLNAADGFDVLAMSFTAPSVAAAWRLTPDVLGAVLSASLAGMGVGALVLSPLADRFGRKPITVIGLLMVIVGMAMAARTEHVGALLAARMLTGIGIGGLISSVTATVTEFASLRARGLVIGLMSMGFPAGAALGGVASLELIHGYGWHAVFACGAAGAIVMLPLVVLLVPESLAFSLARARPSEQARINRRLAAFNLPQAPPSPLPAQAPAVTSRAPLGQARWIAPLTSISLTMLLAMLSFYFLLNWAPKLAVEAGLPPAEGVRAGLLINVGGVAGGFVTGLLLRFLSLRWVGVASLAAMSVGIVVYGALGGQAGGTAWFTLSLGFVMYGVVVVTYMLMTSAFPTEIRATALGLCGTAGRIGSVLGPSLGGLLLGHHLSVSVVCGILAAPALIAAVVVGWSKSADGEPPQPPGGASNYQWTVKAGSL